MTDSTVSTSTTPSSLRPRSLLQHEIRIPRRRSPTGADCSLPGLIATSNFLLYFACKQANDAVVLELLADRPHEDWAQHNLRRVCTLRRSGGSPASKGAEYSTRSLDDLQPRPHNGPVLPSQAKPESAPRVLIVDDDVSVTDTFSRMLRLEGYEVWAALSADEGLSLAQTHHPHAVILDLRMPLTSGLQFLRAIRAIPDLSNTPVAIVTGDYYLDDAQSNEIKELGAELRYKPLWLEELVTLARELLNIASVNQRSGCLT